MPFEVYHKMLEKMSPWQYIKILDDKNLYRQLLYGFNLPERIVECSLGKFLLVENQEIKNSGGGAAIHCSNAGECIIKPSVSSSSGNGGKNVNFVSGIDTITNIPVEEMLMICGRNFVVEKAVIENENPRKLNSSSCNTISVHTYRDINSGKIRFISAFLRIGRNGQFIDNGGAGGICVSLDETGKCIGDTAWTSKTFSSISRTDNGIEIDKYQIDFFEDIVNTAINAHKGLYHFDLIGWDMAANDKNEVVIIEFNPNPDLRLDQVWFKDSCLQDYQDKILKSIYKM